MGERGTGLYRLVEDYAALGDHRTGTAVDAATVDWFASELGARGASLDRAPYSFPRYDAQASLSVDCHEIDALPVFYAAVGEADVEPVVQLMPTLRGIHPLDLDALLATARERPAIVLVPDADHGELLGINRPPGSTVGVPVVVAPAGSTELFASRPRLRWKASIARGRSANVLGRFGTGERVLLLTTPLTGWFGCAGERGTGIALALELARELAEEGPVEVLGTTGHEIGHLGVRQWLESAEAARPGAVLHLGASAAAADRGPDGALVLAEHRFAMTTASDERVDALVEALEGARLPLVHGPSEWPGEGQEWRRVGVDVLSVTGAFSRFHLPSDTAALTTSPTLLETVYDALLASARIVRPR